MKLAGMVGRPLGDLERAGDFGPMKNRSINKTIIAYRFVILNKFIYHFFFVLSGIAMNHTVVDKCRM
jgi:hypothetical protein